MDDKLIHTLQLAMLLVVASVLIIFAHQWISPELVFTTMIAGLAGIVGTRIASNGYISKPTTDNTDGNKSTTQYNLLAIPKEK